MTLLIDADYLIYSSCAACEYDRRWTCGNHTLDSHEDDVMVAIENKLAYYKKVAEDDHNVVMCFSSYPNFRHEIYPDYKINRIGKRPPMALKNAIALVKEKYTYECFTNLEGDDVLGLLSNSKKYDDPIVVSPDKDMRTVPCKLIAKDDIELITKRKANRSFMCQVLSGDPADNYKGLEKVGSVTADKILGDAIELGDMWLKVIEAYKKKGHTINDAILTARLARILRHEDEYDGLTGEVKLWNPKF